MGKKKREKMMVLKRASQGRGFLAPRYSPLVRSILVFLGKWYVKYIERISSIEIKNEATLMQEFVRFEQEKTLLILAFRHVAKEDAPTLMYAFNRNLQKLIGKANVTQSKTGKTIAHAQFLYGKDVLNWAGNATAWLFPKIGCIPVQNRGSNKQGLDILRKAMNEGDFPIALAPEGQVTYHMYRTSPLSKGVASLASWGTKEVTILPIAIAYRYDQQGEDFIRAVLRRWEKQTGKTLPNRAYEPILTLLKTALQETLALLENLYQLEPTIEHISPKNRITCICEKALSEAESLCGLKSEGSFLDRVFRIRFKGEDALHPEHFDPKKLAPLPRSIADFHALQAHVYLRHSQIVDILQYLDLEYLQAPCSEGRACEFALNLLDVVNRMQGGTIASRFTPKHKKAVFFIGKPLIHELSKEPLPRRQGLKTTTDKVYGSLQKTSEELESYWEKKYFKE